MILKINNIDLFDLQSRLKIALNGIEIELNDLDAEESGRAENGVLQRVKLAEAHTLTLTFTPMRPQDLTALLLECRKKFVTIQFSDPFQNFNTTTAEFYNSSRNVKIMSFDRSNSNALYDSVTLKFIGRGLPQNGSGDW